MSRSGGEMVPAQGFHEQRKNKDSESTDEEFPISICDQEQCQSTSDLQIADFLHPEDPQMQNTGLFLGLGLVLLLQEQIPGGEKKRKKVKNKTKPQVCSDDCPRL